MNSLVPACRIQLFGDLAVHSDGRVFTRFRTRKTAVLLAYLAFHLRYPHPREQLIDVVWPEADLPSGRNNLSIALMSLRKMLEPFGTEAGSVLRADRDSVWLVPEAVRVDVADFEASLAAARKAKSALERLQYLRDAAVLGRSPISALRRGTRPLVCRSRSRTVIGREGRRRN